MPHDHRFGDTREEVRRRSAPSGDSIASGQGTGIGTIGDGIWSASHPRAPSLGFRAWRGLQEDQQMPETGLVSMAAAEGAYELRLGHLRAASDISVARFLVELIPRAAPRAVPPASQPTAPSRGDVFFREFRRLTGLAAPCSLFVDGPGSNLLSGLRRPSLLAQRVLDVLVLPGALRTLLDSSWRHRALPRTVVCPTDTRAACAQTATFESMAPLGTHSSSQRRINHEGGAPCT